MEYIDYYKVLGVDRGATQEAIAKAYKRLARKYHPDLNKTAGSESKLKEVNEAYEVLKDPERRKRYDAFGAGWKHGAPFEPPQGFGPGAGGFSGGDFGGFSDFFSAIFGGGGKRRRSTGPVNLEDLLGRQGAEDLFGSRGGGAAHGGDVESSLTVQLEDIYHARKLSVQLDGHTGRRRYAVTIPAGTRDGDRIRLAQQGTRGRGGVQGDLYLAIRVAPHRTFAVDGDDLAVEIAVPAWDAALGARLPVPTLDGPVQMTLPPGLESGQRLRIRGKGLPTRGAGRGDLFARIKISVPKRLSPEQEQLFLRLRAVAAEE